MPQAPSYSDHEQGLIRLTTSSKESVAAVYYPASPGKPTLIYAHGNAEDLGQSVELYQAWNAMGLGVLAYDYPGYGLSTGKPSEASCFRAAESAWEYLTKKGIPASSIIVVGRSIGRQWTEHLAGCGKISSWPRVDFSVHFHVCGKDSLADFTG
ncbi:alpha/beta hydrolase [Luteolibacter pohnpeiensis]|uniref:Alpha/beta hydrolase n=1 Tax=Luteolibacter pohnpeiensis TaxID=454153 RepID=A0A934S881_9BACT|nr:alpha/beta hydrolase [Luteolibacter pohnpeiensis]MBK1882631.1 alpha/beta hydrolase [Luteolibacter pohnpeiensis]